MWIALIIAIVIGGGVLVWWRFVQTYHLATVHEGVLYRDGLRSQREFGTMVRRVKPKTIVCLLDPKEKAEELFAAEGPVCKTRGINYECVEIPLGGWPSDEDVRQFLEVVDRKESQPVLVHCAQGVRRTGMMVAAYQMSVLGWDKEKTKREILTFGHSRRSVGDIEKFIDGYDPVAKTTLAGMPVSAE